MTKKVEICGINTSVLPKLTAVEQRELMAKVKEGDILARTHFVICNMRLVLSIIQRYSMRVNNLDDLFQVGCVGLVKAVDNFNTSLNVRFSTYAVPMIIGEVRRFLRESNSLRVSRGIRDIAYKALQARETLERNSDNEVSLEQIATLIGVPLKEVVYCLDAISEPISIFDPVYSDSDDDSLMVMDLISDKKNNDEHWIENVSLSEAVLKLDDRERLILMKRYFEGKTQMEVSKEVGISQAQVSRLEKTAVKTIKDFL